MRKDSHSNLILGLSCVVFALLVLFLWIPLDVETGFVEKVRRKYIIGDGMAPAVAAIFLLIGGLGLVIFERRNADQPAISKTALKFIAAALALLFVSFAIMRYTGPLAVLATNFLTNDVTEYRLLRDTVPWKYLGYALGGTILIAGLITMIEGKITRKGLIIAVLAVLVMILIYDLPFEDLLLPPNGDV